MAKPRACTLDELPLFATDGEIAAAVVGVDPRRTERYLALLRVLELDPAFPKIDPAHGGRYVPSVKGYYEARKATVPSATTGVQAGHEDPASWRNRKSKRQALR